jgi:hypothetical protein
MVILNEPIDSSNDANWKLTESNTYELCKLQQSWQNLDVPSMVYSSEIESSIYQFIKRWTYQSYQLCTSTKIHKMSGLKHI